MILDMLKNGQNNSLMQMTLQKSTKQNHVWRGQIMDKGVHHGGRADRFQKQHYSENLREYK